jgi:glycerol uptake facilitator-like aquaporin
VAVVFAGHELSGGLCNPALGIGVQVTSAIIDGYSAEHSWIYLIGPLVGGAFAGILLKFFSNSSNQIH